MLTIKLAAASVKVKTAIKASGLAFPKKIGKVTVTVQRKVGTKWVKVGTPKVVTPNGRVQVELRHFKPDHQGHVPDAGQDGRRRRRDPCRPRHVQELYSRSRIARESESHADGRPRGARRRFRPARRVRSGAPCVCRPPRPGHNHRESNLDDGCRGEATCPVSIFTWSDGVSDGQRVLLVHGSVMDGAATWAEQRPLAERWRLIVLDRRGYYPEPAGRARRTSTWTPATWPNCSARPAAWACTSSGSSYGGVVALLAAARRPEAVRSLTVIEPPALESAIGDPRVSAFDARARKYWRDGPRDPEAFLRGFLERAGSRAQMPTPLPPPLDQNARC